MTHLFISHSTRDGGAIAQQLAAALEAAGHRCWIAPRDVKPGVPYPGQIVTAIESCSGLVLVVTPAANESPDVLQEIQLANTARKVIAPVVVNATAPGPDMRYYIGVRHQIPWSDARATTAELLRSFPAGSSSPKPAPAGKSFDEAVKAFQEKAPAWAPSLGPAGADVGEACDVFMVTHGPNKINVIKVIREYTGLGLAEAKNLVESFPPVRVAHRIPRNRAEALVKDLAEQSATMMNPVASSSASLDVVRGSAEIAVGQHPTPPIERIAHELLKALKLEVISGGPGNRYPRGTPGPAVGYRYWATFLERDERLLFGAQKVSGTFDALILARCKSAGFDVRENGREVFIELDDKLDVASLMQAQHVMNELRHILRQ